MSRTELVQLQAAVVELNSSFDAGVEGLTAGFEKRRELLRQADELLDRLIERLPEDGTTGLR